MYLPQLYAMQLFSVIHNFKSTPDFNYQIFKCGRKLKKIWFLPFTKQIKLKSTPLHHAGRLGAAMVTVITLLSQSYPNYYEIKVSIQATQKSDLTQMAWAGLLTSLFSTFNDAGLQETLWSNTDIEWLCLVFATQVLMKRKTLKLFGNYVKQF